MNPDYDTRILWYFQAIFTIDDCLNQHYAYLYWPQNPHATREYNNSQRLSIDLWPEIIRHRVLGSIIIPNSLRANDFLYVWQYKFEYLSYHILLLTKNNMHQAEIVHQGLEQEFLNRSIRQIGPVLWPPRLPNIRRLIPFIRAK